MVSDVWLSAVFEGEDNAGAGRVALIAEECGSPSHGQDAPKTTFSAASRHVGRPDKRKIHQACRAEVACFSLRQASAADEACARYEKVEKRMKQRRHYGDS